MMTQAVFSRYIGVSRKTVTTMKKHGEIVTSGSSVDCEKSISKLKSLGREFDDNSKLVKKNEYKQDLQKPKQNINIFSSEVVPEKNLSNMSNEDRAEREKLIAEAAALRSEVESNEDEDAVDHDIEIGKLDLTSARLIKEYWLGVSLRQKTELASKELVYQKDVDAAQFDLARQIREKLDSRPKNAFKMVGKNIQEIEDVLEKEKDDILEILVGIHVS